VRMRDADDSTTADEAATHSKCVQPEGVHEGLELHMLKGVHIAESGRISI
jgi:hypothetical protein